MQPGKYHRSRSRSEAGFECFELVGVFSGRATKSPGKLTEAALPTWRPVQFICRGSYFLRLHGHFCRKNNLGNNAELALLANFLVRGGSCLRARPTRRENNYGDTAVEATSLAWCAGVGFVPPARRHPQGTSATAAHST